MLLPLLDKLNSKSIILASASANRKQILEKSGLVFTQSPSTFEENMPHSDFATSIDYVVKNTEMKFLNKLTEIKQKLEQSDNTSVVEFADIIIAADTIISLDGKQIVEKPLDKSHAFQMLMKYNDYEYHEVQTAVVIGFINRDTAQIINQQTLVDITKVYFEKIDEATAMAYVESGEPFGKAGGYGIQGQAATLIKKIEGDYYNVWGFPLNRFCSKIKEMLQEIDQQEELKQQ
eukprot:403349306